MKISSQIIFRYSNNLISQIVIPPYDNTSGLCHIREKPYAYILKNLRTLNLMYQDLTIMLQINSREALRNAVREVVKVHLFATPKPQDTQCAELLVKLSGCRDLPYAITLQGLYNGPQLSFEQRSRFQSHLGSAGKIALNYFLESFGIQTQGAPPAHSNPSPPSPAAQQLTHLTGNEAFGQASPVPIPKPLPYQQSHAVNLPGNQTVNPIMAETLQIAQDDASRRRVVTESIISTIQEATMKAEAEMALNALSAISTTLSTAIIFDVKERYTEVESKKNQTIHANDQATLEYINSPARASKAPTLPPLAGTQNHHQRQQPKPLLHNLPYRSQPPLPDIQTRQPQPAPAKAAEHTNVPLGLSSERRPPQVVTTSTGGRNPLNTLRPPQHTHHESSSETVNPLPNIPPPLAENPDTRPPALTPSTPISPLTTNARVIRVQRKPSFSSPINDEPKPSPPPNSATSSSPVTATSATPTASLQPRDISHQETEGEVTQDPIPPSFLPDSPRTTPQPSSDLVLGQPLPSPKLPSESSDN